MSAPLLSVRNLTAGYGGTMVLWDAAVEVRPREVAAMVGRNGMGKTTLMRTLMGFIRPRSGSIVYKGADITTLPTERRAKLGVGYVPQGRLIFPTLTVEENLRMGDRVASLRAGRTLQFERIYQMFPILKERRSQKGGTLSGGQQQMLALGRALVGDPDILLLDEPSEGIQPSIVGDIEQKVLELREAGLTIFLVEQDCQFIKTVADRCYVVEQGRINAVLDRSEFADTDRLEECLAL